MAESFTKRNTFAAQAVKYWLPVLVMLGAMYYFSTDALSGDNTASIIEKLLRWFTADPSERLIRGLNYGLRKFMHFFEYAVLAALLFRAFRADSPARWQLRWAVYSLAVISLWASLDEYHQTTTSDRTGSVRDVLIDVSGGLFMLAALAYFYKKKRR
ncbi:MAG TPA: VanZ family protein [Blastocatellia bacterium]|nr:VanZ family protein [Blastocatellia bacterium]